MPRTDTRAPSTPPHAARAPAPAATVDPQRLITESDLLRFEWVADPQISPDGARIAFTRVWVDATADAYRTCIMMAEFSGGAPRRLTSGALDSQPRWSPDGDTLAFVRGEEGKPSQLYLLPLSGGEATALTALKGGASDPAWSPDGRRIAFRSSHNPVIDEDEKRVKPKHEPGRVVTRPMFREDGDTFTDFEHRKHLWVVEVAGGKPRPLTRGPLEEQPPCWSRDGAWLYFLSDRRAEPWFGSDHADLWAVSPDLEQSTDGAALRKVVDVLGPKTAFAEGPDGRFAFIGCLEPETPHSYDRKNVLLAEGPWPIVTVRVLTAGHDFDFGESITSDQHPPRGGGATPLAFASDGRSILTVVARHGAAMLCRVSVEDGRVEELTDARHEVLHGTCTPDGARWALTVGDATRPVELWSYDAGARALRKLHGPNDALLGERTPGEVEEIWYPSFDGRRIQGWIVKPPGFDPAKRYPLVLEIHGGPHAAYGASFFHEFQVLAAAGYVVLYTNPRGSTTYGQEFGNLIQYRFPGDDYRDLMAGVDAVLSRGYVDPKKLGVTGGSGGGLLTNWVITQTDRFAAAVTQRCVADWASMVYSCDFTLFTPHWFRRAPFEDPQEYLERSPATLASRITTPLMIIHGEEDWRTPIGQGEIMFRALKQQRKVAVMVRFPGEGHEQSRSGVPSRRVQRLEHIRRWFDKYLLGKPVAEYDE